MKLFKLLMFVLLLAACGSDGDANADSSDGGAALGDARDAQPDALSLTPEQISGTYYYVASTVIAPRLPVVYLAELEAEAADDDVITIQLRQLPLSKRDRSTPVGEWSEWRTATLHMDGNFETEELDLWIPEDANAVTGFLTEALLAMQGRMQTPAPGDDDARPAVEFFCGKLSGSILSPIPVDDLSGSTFSATRLAAPDDTSSYPETVINCEGDLARPLD